MRKVISLFLVFSILLLSGNMSAKERKGADVEIYKTTTKIERKMEGTPWESIKLKGASPDLRGELIAVKENSLLLMERESGADVTVDISEIKVVRFFKKSKAGAGLLTGGAIGAFVGIIAYSTSKSNGMDFTAVALGGGGVLGALIGFVLSTVAGTDKTIQIEGKSDSEIQEILEGLRKKARIRNSQ